MINNIKKFALIAALMTPFSMVNVEAKKHKKSHARTKISTNAKTDSTQKGQTNTKDESKKNKKITTEEYKSGEPVHTTLSKEIKDGAIKTTRIKKKHLVNGDKIETTIHTTKQGNVTKIHRIKKRIKTKEKITEPVSDSETKKIKDGDKTTVKKLIKIANGDGTETIIEVNTVKIREENKKTVNTTEVKTKPDGTKIKTTTTSVIEQMSPQPSEQTTNS